jgi:hypothetical protein
MRARAFLSKFAAFYSREISDANNRPKLVVEYAGGSQPFLAIPFSGLAIIGLTIMVVVILVGYAVDKARKKRTSVPSQET